MEYENKIPILPCPFCNGEGVVCKGNIRIKGEIRRCAWVYCSKCGVRTNYRQREYDTHYMKHAIESWNIRYNSKSGGEPVE